MNLKRTPFKYSAVPPPAAPTGTIMFCGDAPGFGIPMGVKHPAEAWHFAQKYFIQGIVFTGIKG